MPVDWSLGLGVRPPSSRLRGQRGRRVVGTGPWSGGIGAGGGSWGLGRSRAVSLGPGTDPSKAAECSDPRPAWSLDAPREAVRLGLGVPLVLAPWSWAPPEPLTLTPRGYAHLLPDLQEPPKSFSLPCVSGATKAGPSAPVLLGGLWVSAHQSTLLLSSLHIVLREDKRQWQPLTLHCGCISRTPSPELSSGPPWVSSSLLSPPPSLVLAPDFNFSKPSPRPFVYLTSSIFIEFCLEQIACGLVKIGWFLPETGNSLLASLPLITAKCTLSVAAFSSGILGFPQP